MESTRVIQLHNKQSIWAFGETEGTVQKLTIDFTGWELEYDLNTLKIVAINKIGESDDTNSRG